MGSRMRNRRQMGASSTNRPDLFRSRLGVQAYSSDSHTVAGDPEDDSLSHLDAATLLRTIGTQSSTHRVVERWDALRGMVPMQR